ncbi:hypothetical protein [Limibacillus sp. MBR-115]|jgi:hypothetical protein|uniref:hypothetical protein n=1 Tax=Limibacillus sp. MBR-115 TaxID=3156465 RepID=UPI003399FC89
MTVARSGIVKLLPCLGLIAVLAGCDKSRIDDLVSRLPSGSSKAQSTAGTGSAGAKVTTPPPEKPTKSEQATGQTQTVNEASLIGLSEAQTEKLFGKPASVSQDPPAVIWRYAGRDCGLALFFYMDVNANAYRVLTYEAEPKERDVSSCAGALHEEKIARSG